MTDPEMEYRRLVSGNVGSVESGADTLRSVRRRLDDARVRTWRMLLDDAVDRAIGVPL